MKAERKKIIWAIILASALIVFFATGCKPKQIIQERVVTKVDSTAFARLINEVSKMDILVEMMKSEIKATREENARLQSEVSTHEIKYDTAAQLKPDGTYPKASETITESRSVLEKTIKELETTNMEYQKENKTLTRINTNLEMTVTALKDENRELKEKITPTTGFNFRLFFSGIGVGALLMFGLWLFLKLR